MFTIGSFYLRYLANLSFHDDDLTLNVMEYSFRDHVRQRTSPDNGTYHSTIFKNYQVFNLYS